MIRRIPGLSQTNRRSNELPDGEYLVRVGRARHYADRNKPYYVLSFEVIQPAKVTQRCFHARLYCTPKSLWKLNWFLRDFGYDPELLGRDELDEKALSGLRGIVSVSYKAVNGTHFLNLDAFAPADRWPELFDACDSNREVA